MWKQTVIIWLRSCLSGFANVKFLFFFYLFLHFILGDKFLRTDHTEPVGHFASFPRGQSIFVQDLGFFCVQHLSVLPCLLYDSVAIIMISWFLPLSVLLLRVAYFKECVRKHSLCFCFLEQMEANWYGFFLKRLFTIHQGRFLGSEKEEIMTQVIYFSMWVLVISVFQGIWPFLSYTKFTGIELLIVVLYYPFRAHEISRDIHSFI